MIQACNLKHVPEITHYCPEQQKGVFSSCLNTFKSKGYTLNLISEIVKIQLSDLKEASAQATTLNQTIYEFCNNFKMSQIDQSKAISDAFDRYIETVRQVKNRILSDFSNRNPTQIAAQYKNLVNIMGNLDKTILDSDNYNHLINTLLTQHQYFKILVKMQEISVQQWKDEMINIKRLLSDLSSTKVKYEPYIIVIPDLTIQTILSHVGISINVNSNVSNTVYSPIKNYSSPIVYFAPIQPTSSMESKGYHELSPNLNSNNEVNSRHQIKELISVDKTLNSNSLKVQNDLEFQNNLLPPANLTYRVKNTPIKNVNDSARRFNQNALLISNNTDIKRSAPKESQKIDSLKNSDIKNLHEIRENIPIEIINQNDFGKIDSKTETQIKDNNNLNMNAERNNTKNNNDKINQNQRSSISNINKLEQGILEKTSPSANLQLEKKDIIANKVNIQDSFQDSGNVSSKLNASLATTSNDMYKNQQLAIQKKEEKKISDLNTSQNIGSQQNQNLAANNIQNNFNNQSNISSNYFQKEIALNKEIDSKLTPSSEKEQALLASKPSELVTNNSVYLNERKEAQLQERAKEVKNESLTFQMEEIKKSLDLQNIKKTQEGYSPSIQKETKISVGQTFSPTLNNEEEKMKTTQDYNIKNQVPFDTQQKLIPADKNQNFPSNNKEEETKSKAHPSNFNKGKTINHQNQNITNLQNVPNSSVSKGVEEKKQTTSVNRHALPPSTHKTLTQTLKTYAYSPPTNLKDESKKNERKPNQNPPSKISQENAKEEKKKINTLANQTKVKEKVNENVIQNAQNQNNIITTNTTEGDYPASNQPLDPTKMFNSQNRTAILSSTIPSKSVYLFNFNYETVNIMDLNTKTINQIETNSINDFPYQGFPFVYLNQGIFLNGGIRNQLVTNNSFQYDIKMGKFIKKGNMKEKRSFHSLIKPEGNFIYTLGGNDQNFLALSSCEKYNLSKDSYENAPKMNIEKSNAFSICMDNRIIYCFFGWNNAKKNYQNVIEKLDITKERESWKMIQLNSSNNILLSRIGSNVCEIQPGIFMIFGGKNEITTYDNCYIFDRSEKLLPHKSVMSLPASFCIYPSQTLGFNNKMYSVCDSKLVHCLNLSTQSWSIDDDFTFNKLND